MRKRTGSRHVKIRTLLEREKDARAREIRAHAVRRGGTEVPVGAAAGDEGDQALLSLEEQLEHVELSRVSFALQTVEAALKTFDTGGYGICQHCGDPIPGRRLRALPTAILCLECQEAAETLRAAGGAVVAERTHPAASAAGRPSVPSGRHSRKEHAGLTPL